MGAVVVTEVSNWASGFTVARTYVVREYSGRSLVSVAEVMDYGASFALRYLHSDTSEGVDTLRTACEAAGVGETEIEWGFGRSDVFPGFTYKRGREVSP